MRRIEFTKYTAPHGTKSIITTTVRDKIADKWQQVRDAGFEFAVELLSTGIISLTIGDENGDYVMQLCNNNNDIVRAVDKLIEDADIPLMQKQSAEKEQADAG